jgi:hypothetical protein
MDTEDQEQITNTNYETLKHVDNVKKCLNVIITDLLKRGEDHDQSKLESPEVELFTTVTHKLKDCSYDSPEYKQFLKDLKPALDHHYSRNRHHPEFFKRGVSDMNIIDLIELLCDWKASTLRHHDGNLRKSIEINRDRFQMSQQLIDILENSIDLFDNIKE